MSSPFDIFRRHQKFMYAVLGIVCMISFVVIPSLTSTSGRAWWQGDSGGGPASVVVTWKGGKITEREMAQMRAAHGICVRFLSGVVEKTLEKQGAPRAAGGVTRENPGIIGDLSEEAVVNVLLMSEKAKQMGITVNDEAVTSFLKDLSDYKLTDDEIRKTAEAATNNQMGVSELFEQLRLELMAQHVRLVGMSEFNAQAVSLVEGWDYHNRLYRRVSIEAYPVEVAQYIGKVTGQPTEAEKRKLFDDHKFRDPDPSLPEPGFHHPLKQAFDYLKIDYAPYLEEAKKAITDEQMQKEYETRKERGDFKVPDLPENKEPTKEKPAEGEKKPDENTPAPESKDQSKTAEPKKPACDPGDEESLSTEGEQLAQAADAPAAATKKEEPKPTTNPPADNKPAEGKPEDKKTETEDPAKKEEKKEEKKETPTRIRTFEEVKDQLHTQLAQPAATEAKDKAIQAVMAELREYSRKYLVYTSAKKHATGTFKPEDPGKLDVDKLAKKYGFKSGTVPLVDRFEVAKFDLGKEGMYFNRNVDFRTVRDFSQLTIPFANFAFGQRLGEFDPRQLDSFKEGVEFIFWVTEIKEAAAPKYEDPATQQAIVAAWKRTKALELAKKDAAELAKQAESKAALKEVVQDEKKILTPVPFSWMTPGAVAFGAGEPRLSTVVGVEQAGYDFMSGVCALPVGGAGTAVDQPHNVVYVVKVLSQDPSEQVLRERFLESGLSPPIRRIGAEENYMRMNAWFRNVGKELGVAWQRLPDRGGADE